MTVIARINFQGQVSRDFALFAKEELAVANSEVRTSCSQLRSSDLQLKIFEIAAKHLKELNKAIEDQKDDFDSPLDEKLVQKLMKEFIGNLR